VTGKKWREENYKKNREWRPEPTPL